MPRYTNDPRKITSKFDSSCTTCGKKIRKGDTFYYWPLTRTAYCLVCGEKDYREFLLNAQDEDDFINMSY